MKDLKLKRQQFALEKILEAIKKEKEDKENRVKNPFSSKEYKTRVEGLGMVIYNHNLITAMAWLKSKNNTLFNHVKDWLTGDDYPMKLSNANFLKTLTQLNSTQLMVYTEEVLLLSDALKEFAKAEIKTD